VLFKDLQLTAPVLQALETEGYHTPTPIQFKAIPFVLAGRDVLACAQTGTGKTAAFTIPLLQRMAADTGNGHRAVRALILTPTRELAIQIGESIAAYGRFLTLRHTVIFGGVSQHSQVQALRKGVDILVATPGRLLDLLQQREISLASLEYFVLDEADRMLDMGFIHDVKRIIAQLPKRRQTLFFSATMPKEIQQLAAVLLHNPAKVEVAPPATTAELIAQSVYFAEKEMKPVLLKHLLRDEAIRSILVFTRTKHGANKLVKILASAGIQSAAIHGNKSQQARQTALLQFKSGTLRVLVATDIAARGIDIDSLTHVLNYELPNVPETYVHRIGRTGRAGAAGQAISFCDTSERPLLQDIEKLIRKKVPVLALPALTIPQVAKSVVHHTPPQSGQQRNGTAHRSEKPAHVRGQFRGHGAPQKRFSRGRSFQQS